MPKKSNKFKKSNLHMNGAGWFSDTFNKIKDGFKNKQYLSRGLRAIGEYTSTPLISKIGDGAALMGYGRKKRKSKK